jgi:oxygen-independent coproporphyrinogen-3 oxidase
MLSTFSADLKANAYPGYVYGYPHKKAYRPLSPRPLADAWAGEAVGRLFCYVHIPWCAQRCSFCNLFTQATRDGSGVPAYLDALRREMEAFAAAVPGARFARLYVGGGTPTYLDVRQLERLAGDLREVLGVDPARTHGCIEASPDSLDDEKAAALVALGFQRLSLGVQSFREGELAAVNRRFEPGATGRAIAAAARAGFARLNVDLIYGLPGQTRESWRGSLAEAIDTPATGLFLYPLYVRPMTGLGVRHHAPTPGEMAGMYDDALEMLGGAGFRQVTMRQFRRDGGGDDGEYRCQEDGMLGLGAGARSYTRAVHYSTPWRMIQRNIADVIEGYVSDMRAGDVMIRHGVE